MSCSFYWKGCTYSVTLKTGGEDEERFSIKAKLFTSISAETTKKIGSLQMYLLQRPSPYFFEFADEISSEMIALARTFCEPNGTASRIQHPRMTPDALRGGGFLNLYTVEIDPEYQKQDLGLRFTHEVLVALKGKWTLATILPCPLSRYFCKWKANARFPEQNELRPSSWKAGQTNTWFLTASAYFLTPDPNATWLTKTQASNITIQERRKKVEPSGLDKELKEAVVALASPIQFASIQRIEELVRRGANVNRSGCLQAAAANIANPQVLQSLLRLGGDIDYQDELGNSALHVAASLMKQEIVHWLIGHGADRSTRNLDGRTPLECLQEACNNASDMWAAFGHFSMPAREIDCVPKLHCITALMQPEQQALLIDGWMSPRMKEMLYITAEIEMEQILNTHDVSFAPRTPTPLSECTSSICGISRINYIPSTVLTTHNPNGLYASFNDGWGYCFLAARALLARGQAPTVQRVEQYIQSANDFTVDQRKFQHFKSHYGKVEYALDALINTTRNVAIDGDDGWEYWTFERDIEALPATPLDRMFDIAWFKCINQGGGEGLSRGPYRHTFMDYSDEDAGY